MGLQQADDVAQLLGEVTGGLLDGCRWRRAGLARLEPAVGLVREGCVDQAHELVLLPKGDAKRDHTVSIPLLCERVAYAIDRTDERSGLGSASRSTTGFATTAAGAGTSST